MAIDLVDELVSLCELRDISKVLDSCHLVTNIGQTNYRDVRRDLRTSSVVGSCLLIAFRSSIKNIESSRSRSACRMAGYPILKRDNIMAAPNESVRHPTLVQASTLPILFALVVSKSVMTFCFPAELTIRDGV
jgi:hypothetical protein